MDPIDRELSDPATSPQRLAEIGASYPERAAAIAVHPNAYAELQEWARAVWTTAQQPRDDLSVSPTPAYADVAQAYGEAQYGHGAPQRQTAPHPQAAASPPVLNPLVGLPVVDCVRDVAAWVLLLGSLGLPWSFRVETLSPVTAGGNVTVLLVTLLSVLSVAVTYLARAGLLGLWATPVRTVVLRAALGSPYVIVTLVYVVLDACGVGDSATVGWRAGPGVGAAAVVGLAGALLAASPRTYEVRDSVLAAPIARWSRGAAVSVLVLTLGFGLGGTIARTVTIGSQRLLGAATTGDVVSSVVVALIAASAAAVPLALVVARRSESARVIGAGVGTALLVITFIDAMTGFRLEPIVQGFSVSVMGSGALGIAFLRLGGLPALWLGACAAVLTTPGLRLTLRVYPEEPSFLGSRRTIRAALLTLTVVGGAFAVLTILALVMPGDLPRGMLVGVLILLLGVTATARALQVVNDQGRGSRTAIAAGLLVAAVLTLAAGILAAVAGSPHVDRPGIPETAFFASGLWIFVAGFGLLGTVTCALFVPTARRPHAGPVAGAVAAAAPSAAGAPDARSQRAADAATPLDELQAYAAEPALWPALAANPRLYPELAEWLSRTGDPQVLAVLARRGADGA